LRQEIDLVHLEWADRNRIITVPLLGCPSENDTKATVGSTVDLGSEFGLTSNVSAKGEIIYFDLGTDRRNLGGIDEDLQRSGFLSTIGLNFRFGG
jgi:opacity protein-like surface antigen